jgi:hypothetical protein
MTDQQRWDWRKRRRRTRPINPSRFRTIERV